ncbi:MAG TPA: hypothetical protein ENF75_00625 [Acidilobales archaeon]|nr:hypothetical protein [Acidilobales archaeon]
MDPTSPKLKQELLDLIIDGGLLEDFIQWIKSKGIDIDFIKDISDIDLNTILEYAHEKGLLDTSPEELKDDLKDNVESLEPLGYRPRTPPRKK